MKSSSSLSVQYHPTPKCVSESNLVVDVWTGPSQVGKQELRSSQFVQYTLSYLSIVFYVVSTDRIDSVLSKNFFDSISDVDADPTLFSFT